MSDNTSFEVLRPLPVNLENKDNELFRRSSRFLVNPARRLLLREVFIFWQGQVFKNGKILVESLCTPLFLKKYSPAFFLTCLLKSMLRGKFLKLRKSSYLVIHDEWSSNYFHWLTDVVTRLYAVKDVLHQYTLILPESFKNSYNLYTLAKFNIRNIEWTDDRKILFADEVLLSLHTAPAGNYNPELLRNAISLLLHDQVMIRNRGPKVYISRQKAAERKVINEDEVISFLQSRGFAVLYCEDLSFEDQVSILFHAKVLVSIHGAGLANLMFMKPDSSVLELRKESDAEMYNCYFTLASVFNMRYFYQSCSSDSDLPVSKANIFVDINKLRENLALIEKL